VNFDEEQAEMLDEIDRLLTSCLGKGPSWGRYKGDVVCRVVAEHIQRHLPMTCKVVGPSVYVEGFPWEFDLMVVADEAETLPYTNAYKGEDVHCIIEVKKHGIYGRREELEGLVKARIKAPFDSVVSSQSRIKALYLAVKETIEPTKTDAIRYADVTEKALYPYAVYFLQDTRGNRIQRGEWQRFIKDVLAGLT
jgi:hypothetical protein